MAIIRLQPITALSTVLVLLILSGIHMWLIYFLAFGFLIVLAKRHTIHFIYLMLLSNIAIYELGRPYINIIGINLYFTDLYILVCLIYLISEVFRRGVTKYSNTVETPFKLFFLIVLLGSVNGIINGVQLKNLMRDLGVFGGYLSIPIALNAFRNEMQLRKFTRLIVRIGILMAILGISMRILGIENVTGFQGSAGVGTAFGRFSRAYGLSGGTSFMVAAIFILISSSGIHLKTYFREMVAIAITFTQLLLLFARSLFLGIASGFAVLFLTSGARITIFVIIIILLSLIAIYLISELVFESNYVPAIADRYLSIISERFGDERALANIARRENEFIAVWNSLSWSERVFGLGMGSRILVEVDEATELSGYHNSYATCIQRIGLIGLFAYILFLFSTIREAIRLKCLASADRNLYSLGAGFLCIFIALAMWGSGASGMPLNANVLAGVSLGVALRIFLILRKKGTAVYV